MNLAAQAVHRSAISHLGGSEMRLLARVVVKIDRNLARQDGSAHQTRRLPAPGKPGSPTSVPNAETSVRPRMRRAGLVCGPKVRADVLVCFCGQAQPVAHRSRVTHEASLSGGWGCPALWSGEPRKGPNCETKPEPEEIPQATAASPQTADPIASFQLALTPFLGVAIQMALAIGRRRGFCSLTLQVDKSGGFTIQCVGLQSRSSPG